jgi:hypothetical protein
MMSKNSNSESYTPLSEPIKVYLQTKAFQFSEKKFWVETNFIELLFTMMFYGSSNKTDHLSWGS